MIWWIWPFVMIVHLLLWLKVLMMKRELAKDPALANENWDRFLPKFKKYAYAILLHILYTNLLFSAGLNLSFALSVPGKMSNRRKLKLKRRNLTRPSLHHSNLVRLVDVLSFVLLLRSMKKSILLSICHEIVQWSVHSFIIKWKCTQNSRVVMILKWVTIKLILQVRTPECSLS